mgnify:FL=1
MTRINSPQDADVLIQKLPSDMGIHRNPRKGTLDGPDRILEDFSTYREMLVEKVFPDEFSLEETQQRIAENTEDLMQYGKPLVSLGGDHSVSFPAVKALKKEMPDLKLVWLDAHLDLKEKVDGHVSHDVVVRELLNSGFSLEEIYFVGTTKVDGDEKEFLEGKEPQIYRSSDIQDFIREFSPGEQPVYLSLDIDVLSEEEAPGTGYPDGELSPEEVSKVVDAVKPSYADLVEVAPSLDTESRTVENSRNLLESIITGIDC